MTTDVYPVTDDIGRLLGASHIATAVSALFFIGLVAAGVFFVLRSGVFPPPSIDDQAPVISIR